MYLFFGKNSFSHNGQRYGFFFIGEIVFKYLLFELTLLNKNLFLGVNKEIFCTFATKNKNSVNQRK